MEPPRNIGLVVTSIILLSVSSAIVRTNGEDYTTSTKPTPTEKKQNYDSIFEIIRAVILEFIFFYGWYKIICLIIRHICTLIWPRERYEGGIVLLTVPDELAATEFSWN